MLTEKTTFMKPLKKNSKRVFILKKNSSFNKLFSTGKSFHSGDIVLKSFVNDNELNMIRFGFAVVKNPHFNAVKKNRIKRLLKEAVIKKIDFINESFSSGDYIIAFQGSPVTDSEHIFKNVFSVLKKVVLSKKNT